MKWNNPFVDARPDSNNDNSAPFRTLLWQQRQNAPIQSRQPSFPVYCESKEVSIGNLLVSEKSFRERFNRSWKTNIVCPEAMSRMT